MLKEKPFFVAANVKSINPVVDRIVPNLCKIDLINYVRVSQDGVQASSEIKIKGRTKIPILTTDLSSVVGVDLILDLIESGFQK